MLPLNIYICIFCIYFFSTHLYIKYFDRIVIIIYSGRKKWFQFNIIGETEWLILRFNGMSIFLGLYFVLTLGNRIHFIFIFTLLKLFFKRFFKYSNLIGIIGTQLYGFKYSYLILIIVYFRPCSILCHIKSITRCHWLEETPWCCNQCTGLQYRRKRVQTPVALLRLFFGPKSLRKMRSLLSPQLLIW